MKRTLQGQITILDYMEAVENQKRLSIHGGNCYRCVFEESHRCRNNWNKPCPDGMQFEEYTGSKVKQCIGATMEIFQDGYMHCPILETEGMGCVWCMERLKEDKSFFRYDPSQNYERNPRWEKSLS